jgi:glycosyltransferase involved in cell wall biosynthesis
LKKKNLLIVSIRVPRLGGKGDQVLAFHRIKSLIPYYRISLICFTFKNDKDLYLDDLIAMGVNVHTVSFSTFSAIFSLLSNVFNNHIPLQCAFFRSRELTEKINKVINTSTPVLIHYITLRSFINHPRSQIKYSIDLIDSLALNFIRRSINSNLFSKLFFKLESTKLLNFERRVVETSSLSFIVSGIDKAYIGSDRINIIPLGVDVESFSEPLDFEVVQEPVLLFSGNMSYEPNITAIKWFITECWNDLKQKIPHVKLIIAGRSPSAEVKAFSNINGVEVTGEVLSMVEVFKKSSIAIAPMQSGAGMQLKILEAMSYKLPVIATTIGLGDIKAEIGRDIIVAGDSSGFIDAIENLCIKSDYRKFVADNGYNYVLNHHNKNKIAEILVTHFNSFVTMN